MNENLDGILNSIAGAKFSEKFLEKRSIFFWGEVDDESAEKVINKLLYLEMENPGKQITMYISSPGGSVTSGMAILDTMKMISSPVKTVCIGLCASMASLLLSAGEKGSREIFQHGEVMIHQPLIGGHFQDKASNLEITAKNILKTKRITAEILAANCGKDVEKVMQDIEEDHWMDAKEALEYGIVDKISEKIEF
ncbi:MAG: ATP-dependent Clp protease proteolytic subunit [Bacteroidales bacterium]|jgi:ATP-dependent Clp protease protease subunit|nr:ATP-dependent Clp protease proteolytic subunit [Bacteroidales bacterium]MBQ5540591.1 ATP-dependent Clp protease proteolytic subunit [Bacteroidales bacterium]MBR4677917.1 ATP-dependent Clp protease proteolytic subunit [Bacteroidales bacterium]MEE3448935.1 ATP-dependent Clp protease proteolytic subunit [Bacteroidales bacterium]